MRDTMLGLAIELLSDKHYPEFARYRHTREVLEKRTTDIQLLTKSDPWDFHPVAQIMASFFGSSTVGMKFDLTTYEKNKNTASVKLNNSGGTHVVDVKISDHASTNERKNQRQIDTDVVPFARLNALKCAKDFDSDIRYYSKVKDWSYPLRGNIDLGKFTSAFVRYTLTESSRSGRHELAQVALTAAMLRKKALVTGEKIKKLSEQLCSTDKPLDDKTRAVLTEKLLGYKAMLETLNKQLKYLAGDYLADCPIIKGDNDCKTKKNEYAASVSSSVLEFVETGEAAQNCYKNQCTKAQFEEANLYVEILDIAGRIYNYLLYTRGQINGKKPASTDTITFTTTLDGGVNPSITFGNAGSFKVNLLGWTASNQRVDTHKLTLSATAVEKFELFPSNKTPDKVLIGGDAGYQLYVHLPTKSVPVQQCAAVPDRTLVRLMSDIEPVTDQGPGPASFTGPFLSYEPSANAIAASERTLENAGKPGIQELIDEVRELQDN